jgi:hypothetical protein
MKLAATRKAVGSIRRKGLKKDIESVITSIEKSAKKEMETAGRRTTGLMGLVISLDETLPRKTRLSILNAIFDDAETAEVPHQWERKTGFECGPKNDCGKVNKKTVCFRDTWTGECHTVKL